MAELIVDNPDLPRKRAAAKVEYAVRELFANMLRLGRSRQGGDISMLWSQIADVVDAVVEHEKFDKFMPYEAIRDGLDLSNAAWHRHWREPQSVDFDSEERPIEIIIRGAAQVMASRLLGQKTQEAAGHHEMFLGIRELCKKWGGHG